MLSRTSMILLLVVFFFIKPLFAETIILKSGKKIEGKVLERTDKYIKVDCGVDIPLTYFFDLIESIDGVDVNTYKSIPVTNKEISSSKQATLLSNKGLLLTIDGKWDEGLELMKQATELEPENGLLHMNYGSTLFAKGQIIYKNGKIQEGEKILKKAEDELLLATESSTSENIVKSQSSFLLGDIYLFVHKDKERAKSFYQKSLEYFPEHGGSLNALKEIDSGIQTTEVGAMNNKEIDYGKATVTKTLKPHFDNRKWNIGYQAEDNQGSIVEYVLEGETVEDWSELVTVQFFIGLRTAITPEQFMKGKIERITASCPSVEWNVLSKNDYEIIYEWKIINCQGQSNQHEIERIILSNDGIYCVMYVTKNIPILTQKREEWIRLLKIFG